MKTLLIGLGSKARIGKDYASQELAKHFDLERIAFADELKKDLAGIMSKSNIDYWEIEKEPALKETVRPLLVAYGQVMRKFNEDIWVDRAIKNKEFRHQVTLITDVRFPNEAKRLKELGGFYIEIETNIPPANETEALYSPQMAGLADYKVRNNFDSKFIQSLVDLVNRLLPCQKIQ